MNIILFGIYIVLSIVLAVIGLFIGNIILFDSILFAALSGLLCHTLWTLHLAYLRSAPTRKGKLYVIARYVTV